jgi:hypothetical protein
MPTRSHTQIVAADHHRHSVGPRLQQTLILTLSLDGITPHDYIQWIRDPEPPNRDDLMLTAVTVTPPDQIRIALRSEGDPPPATVAASAVGFPITPEVIGVSRRLITRNNGWMPHEVPRRRGRRSPR